jgi:hypothetical protein
MRMFPRVLPPIDAAPAPRSSGTVSTGVSGLLVLGSPDIPPTPID